MRKSAKTHSLADEKSAMHIVVLGKTRGLRLRYAPAFFGILRKGLSTGSMRLIEYAGALVRMSEGCSILRRLLARSISWFCVPKGVPKIGRL